MIDSKKHKPQELFVASKKKSFNNKYRKEARHMTIAEEIMRTVLDDSEQTRASRD